MTNKLKLFGAIILNVLYIAIIVQVFTHSAGKKVESLAASAYVPPQINEPKMSGTSTAANARAGDVLGTFATEMGAKKGPRVHNITLAASLIDGVIVEPGEEFSFNDAVGPTTKANGFKLARIFIKGQKADGYGGGVCQVSSTLFNAADEAGLQITERHDHSLPPGYLPVGRDAATSYGVKDFRFVNTLPYTVEIYSSIHDGKLYVSILRA